MCRALANLHSAQLVHRLCRGALISYKSQEAEKAGRPKKPAMIPMRMTKDYGVDEAIASLRASARPSDQA